ncbi:MAG: DNA alkylation repair protein [Chthoniobacterales bacterium]
MEPFKNMLSADVARGIGRAAERAHPAFEFDAYAADIDASLAALELKARMHHIADRLMKHLPDAPQQLFPVLIQCVRSDPDDLVGLHGFPVWPLTEIVARRGDEDFDLAMVALAELTKVFTAEFAIRSFLLNHPDRTLAQMVTWASDPNEHVRRLASEGSRPLLPWGERLPEILANPQSTLPIMDRLHDDPSEYVRRSVANHLNDFSRAHPDHVLNTLRRWQKSEHKDFPRLLKRAARTLVKAGHPDAMALIGYRANPAIEVLCLKVTPGSVAIGESITLSLEVMNASDHPVPLMVDYAIFHLKANGTRSRKVFKGRSMSVPPNQPRTISIRHSFRPITTRKYYPGEHLAQIVLNGIAGDQRPFKLTLTLPGLG